MLQGILTQVILRFANQYISNLEADLNLWAGDVLLNDLQLRIDVLNHTIATYGVKLSLAFIRLLKVSIPWRSLTSSSICVELSGLDIHLCYIGVPAVTTLPPRKLSEQPITDGWGDSILKNIINNVSLVLNDITIRLDICDSSFILKIQSISFLPTNENHVHGYTEVEGPWKLFFKHVIVSGVSISLVHGGNVVTLVTPFNADLKLTSHLLSGDSQCPIENLPQIVHEFSVDQPRTVAQLEIVTPIHLSVSSSLLEVICRVMEMSKRQDAPNQLKFRDNIYYGEDVCDSVQSPAPSSWGSYIWGSNSNTLCVSTQGPVEAILFTMSICCIQAHLSSSTEFGCISIDDLSSTTLFCDGSISTFTCEHITLYDEASSQFATPVLVLAPPNVHDQQFHYTAPSSTDSWNSRCLGHQNGYSNFLSSFVLPVCFKYSSRVESLPALSLYLSPRRVAIYVSCLSILVQLSPFSTQSFVSECIQFAKSLKLPRKVESAEKSSIISQINIQICESLFCTRMTDYLEVAGTDDYCDSFLFRCFNVNYAQDCKRSLSCDSIELISASIMFNDGYWLIPLFDISPSHISSRYSCIAAFNPNLTLTSLSIELYVSTYNCSFSGDQLHLILYCLAAFKIYNGIDIEMELPSLPVFLQHVGFDDITFSFNGLSYNSLSSVFSMSDFYIPEVLESVTVSGSSGPGGMWCLDLTPISISVDLELMHSLKYTSILFSKFASLNRSQESETSPITLSIRTSSVCLSVNPFIDCLTFVSVSITVTPTGFSIELQSTSCVGSFIETGRLFVCVSNPDSDSVLFHLHAEPISLILHKPIVEPLLAILNRSSDTVPHPINEVTHPVVFLCIHMKSMSVCLPNTDYSNALILSWDDMFAHSLNAAPSCLTHVHSLASYTVCSECIIIGSDFEIPEIHVQCIQLNISLKSNDTSQLPLLSKPLDVFAYVSLDNQVHVIDCSIQTIQLSTDFNSFTCILEVVRDCSYLTMKHTVVAESQDCSYPPTAVSVSFVIDSLRASISNNESIFILTFHGTRVSSTELSILSITSLFDYTNHQIDVLSWYSPVALSVVIGDPLLFHVGKFSANITKPLLQFFLKLRNFQISSLTDQSFSNSVPYSTDSPTSRNSTVFKILFQGLRVSLFGIVAVSFGDGFIMSAQSTTDVVLSGVRGCVNGFEIMEPCGINIHQSGVSTTIYSSSVVLKLGIEELILIETLKDTMFSLFPNEVSGSSPVQFQSPCRVNREWITLDAVDKSVIEWQSNVEGILVESTYLEDIYCLDLQTNEYVRWDVGCRNRIFTRNWRATPTASSCTVCIEQVPIPRTFEFEVTRLSIYFEQIRFLTNILSVSLSQMKRSVFYSISSGNIHVHALSDVLLCTGASLQFAQADDPVVVGRAYTIMGDALTGLELSTGELDVFLTKESVQYIYETGILIGKKRNSECATFRFHLYLYGIPVEAYVNDDWSLLEVERTFSSSDLIIRVNYQFVTTVQFAPRKRIFELGIGFEQVVYLHTFGYDVHLFNDRTVINLDAVESLPIGKSSIFVPYDVPPGIVFQEYSILRFDSITEFITVLMPAGVVYHNASSTTLCISGIEVSPSSFTSNQDSSVAICCMSKTVTLTPCLGDVKVSLYPIQLCYTCISHSSMTHVVIFDNVQPAFVFVNLTALDFFIAPFDYLDEPLYLQKCGGHIFAPVSRADFSFGSEPSSCLFYFKRANDTNWLPPISIYHLVHGCHTMESSTIVLTCTPRNGSTLVTLEDTPIAAIPRLLSSVRVSISRFSVTLEDPEPLLSFDIFHFDSSILHHDTETIVAFTISDYQVENLSGDAVYPIIMYPQSTHINGFELHCRALAPTSLFSWSVDTITLRFHPMFVYLESNMLSVLTQIAKGYLDTFNESKEEYLQIENFGDVLSSIISECLTPNIFFGMFSIDRLSVILSVAASGSGINIVDAPVSFLPLAIHPVLCSTSRFIQEITANYVADIILRSPFILGSIDLLGNPTQVYQKVQLGVSNLLSIPRSASSNGTLPFIRGIGQGIGSLIFNISQGTLLSISAFSSSIARHLDAISYSDSFSKRRGIARLQPPSGVLSGVSTGLYSASNGILGAVVGLISAPVHGMQEHGAAGFFVGITHAISGAVTKPIGGMMDLVSHTSRGIAGDYSGLKRRHSLRTRHKPFLFPHDENMLSIPTCILGDTYLLSIDETALHIYSSGSWEHHQLSSVSIDSRSLSIGDTTLYLSIIDEQRIYHRTVQFSA